MPSGRGVSRRGSGIVLGRSDADGAPVNGRAVAAETLRTVCEGTMLRRLFRIAVLSAAWMAILALLSIVALRWVPPPTTSFMIAERITAPSQKIEYDWVPWSSISPQAALAVIASED